MREREVRGAEGSGSASAGLALSLLALSPRSLSFRRTASPSTVGGWFAQSACAHCALSAQSLPLSSLAAHSFKHSATTHRREAESGVAALRCNHLTSCAALPPPPAAAAVRGERSRGAVGVTYSVRPSTGGGCAVPSLRVLVRTHGLLGLRVPRSVRAHGHARTRYRRFAHSSPPSLLVSRPIRPAVCISTSAPCVLSRMLLAACPAVYPPSLAPLRAWCVSVHYLPSQVPEHREGYELW